MKSRKYGTGTITLVGDRYRARVQHNGQKVHVGMFDTEDLAEQAIAAFCRLAAVEGSEPIGLSLRSYGKRWLHARATDGVHRGERGDASVWASRIETAPFAALPLTSITPRDIRDWVAYMIRTPITKGHGHKVTKRKLPGRSTVKNALNLLRVCLQSAVDANLLDTNPAREVRVPKMARSDQAWTYLTIHEIQKLEACSTIAQAPMAALMFSIYSGLRQGEVWGLEWTSVDLPNRRIKVCKSYNDPTKPGEVRWISLLATAYEILQTQKAISGKTRLVFPGPKNGVRSKGYDAQLSANLRRAGITRHVRFHDLRHTCASHLIMGSWGRSWSIEEIKEWLGHASIDVTQRYAHLSHEGIARAARETPVRIAPVIDIGTKRDKNESDLETDSPANPQQSQPVIRSHLSESNGRPTVYETVALPTELRWQTHSKMGRSSSPRRTLCQLSPSKRARCGSPLPVAPKSAANSSPPGKATKCSSKPSSAP